MFDSIINEATKQARFDGYFTSANINHMKTRILAAFDDLEENVRQQVQRVKSHPWIPQHIPVRGFIYDVKTGALTEVAAER